MSVKLERLVEIALRDVLDPEMGRLPPRQAVPSRSP